MSSNMCICANMLILDKLERGEYHSQEVKFIIPQGQCLVFWCPRCGCNRGRSVASCDHLVPWESGRRQRLQTPVQAPASRCSIYLQFQLCLPQIILGSGNHRAFTAAPQCKPWFRKGQWADTGKTYQVMSIFVMSRKTPQSWKEHTKNIYDYS